MCFVLICVLILSEKEQAALPHCSDHKLPGPLHLSGSPAGRLHSLYEAQVSLFYLSFPFFFQGKQEDFKGLSLLYGKWKKCHLYVV